MNYPVTFDVYIPEAASYGSHILVWSHEVSTSGNQLILSCEGCKSIVRHPMKTTGSGRILITAKNEYLEKMNMQTVDLFMKMSVPSCEEQLIRSVQEV